MPQSSGRQSRLLPAAALSRDRGRHTAALAAHAQSGKVSCKVAPRGLVTLLQVLPTTTTRICQLSGRQASSSCKVAHGKAAVVKPHVGRLRGLPVITSFKVGIVLIHGNALWNVRNALGILHRNEQSTAGLSGVAQAAGSAGPFYSLLFFGRRLLTGRLAIPVPLPWDANARTGDSCLTTQS